MKKILISTGGSGGHVIPALTIYEHLRYEFEVSLVTDKRGSKFIEKNLLDFEIIDVPNIFSNLFMLPINIMFFIFSTIKSIIFLKKNKIEILFSTGGYMSLPLCIASWILNLNIYLFEPNMVIGRANRLILKFSKKILCYQNSIIGLPEIYKSKIFIISPLLRKEIYNMKQNINKKILEPIKIIVLGGSQGAKFFDEKIKDLLINLSKFYKIYICQQVYNKNKINELKIIYNKLNIESNLFYYSKDLHRKYNSFDLAITRAGASAISELCHLNIPFIAVPFPYAKDNHQLYNAKYYSDKDCCWMINQNEFEIQKISVFIKNLIDNQSDYFNKKENLNKNSYQNTWNNINQKLVRLIYEN